MVEHLEDVKGYSELSCVDKVKYAVGLKHYLDNVKSEDLELMDIISMRKSTFKIPVYYTVFMFGDLEKEITIKFKKSMLLKS